MRFLLIVLMVLLSTAADSKSLVVTGSDSGVGWFEHAYSAYNWEYIHGNNPRLLYEPSKGLLISSLDGVNSLYIFFSSSVPVIAWYRDR